MRNRIWSGSFAAIVGVAAVSLAAQTTPPSQTTTASSSSDKKITVTGCLQAMPSSAPETTAGTSGTTGTAGTAGTTGTASAAAGAPAASDQQFILTNAVASSADSASPETGTANPQTGTTTTAPQTGQSASSGQTYRLIANPTALSPHVGKKVEVTGTLVEGSASAAGPSTTTSSESSAMASAPALKVEAGKVLTAPCSQ